jgi:hypothetical protein
MISFIQIMKMEMQNIMQKGGNYAKVKQVLPQSSPFWGKNIDKIIPTWNFGIILY